MRAVISRLFGSLLSACLIPWLVKKSVIGRSTAPLFSKHLFGFTCISTEASRVRFWLNSVAFDKCGRATNRWSNLRLFSQFVQGSIVIELIWRSWPASLRPLYMRRGREAHALVVVTNIWLSVVPLSFNTVKSSPDHSGSWRVLSCYSPSHHGPDLVSQLLPFQVLAKGKYKDA